MSLFAFDEQFTLFGSTPVDNQFILEYLPGARGEYVKVYLYGLMHCYHPMEDLSVTQMAREMNLTDEDVLAAYRYWERKGLVRRISDQPPAWRYISVKQRLLNPAGEMVDPAYAEFAEAMYGLFGADRKLTTREMSMAYEWVADMNLPPEVVLMLISHCKEHKGKHFSFKAAEKLAIRLAEENVRTAEEAGEFFLRDEQIMDGSRAVLRRLGKRRNPSDDEMDMYARWVRAWGYDHEAVLAACAETTKGEPTFAYLNGILKGMMARQGRAMTTGSEVEQARQADAARIAPLKELLRTMNIQGVTINDATLAVYDQMRALYQDDVILLAGRECARQGRGLDDVMSLLASWQKKNLRTAEDVEKYIGQINELGAVVKLLYEQWGKPARVTAADRDRVHRWLHELGLGMEMILCCAEFAAGAAKPMPYLDKLLTDYAAQGVCTPEAAMQARAAHQAQQAAKPAAPARPVQEQQYHQREYEETSGMSDWMKELRKEMNGDAQ